MNEVKKYQKKIYFNGTPKRNFSWCENIEKREREVDKLFFFNNIEATFKNKKSKPIKQITSELVLPMAA